MSALDDLREHAVPGNPWLLQDPDAWSFHEVVCDLARQAARRHHRYRDLPDEIVQELARLNGAVARIAGYLSEADPPEI